MTRPILKTPVCDLLGIEYPILLAGMGNAAAIMPDDSPVGASSPELVAAVSNAGGLGVLGAASTPPDIMREHIHYIQKTTDKPFGVDLILPTNTAGTDGDPATQKSQIPEEYRQALRELKQEFGLPDIEAPAIPGQNLLLSKEVIDEKIEILFEEHVPVFAVGLGSPGPYVERARETGMKIIAVIGNTKTARRAAEAGSDLIVAQGTEGGGHTGRVGTMALIPQVVDTAAPTPVVAAGGIADGRGVAAAFCLGAVGAWVGTAFLATEEANIHPQLKERIVEATDEDTRVTRVFSGKTMRNVTNQFIEAWEARNLQALPMGLQGLLVSDFVYAAKEAGRTDLIMNAAGQAAGMLKEIKPARQLLEEMVEQAVDVLKNRVPEIATLS